MEVLIGLGCALGVLLAVVTIVGHVMWLVLAAIVRVLRPESRRAREELLDREAMVRQIDRFQRDGLLDAETARRLKQLAVAGSGFATPRPKAPRVEQALEALDEPIAPQQQAEIVAWFDESGPWGIDPLTAPAAERLAQILVAQDRAPQALLVYEQLGQRGLLRPEAELAAARIAWTLGQTPRAARGARSARARGGLELAAAADELLRQMGVSIAPDVLEPAALGPIGAAQPVARPGATTESEPRRPRRTLGQWMSGFMEERNIRWGELMGGLLIVGGSIMLVVSLWSTLQERIPYFQFVLFVGMNAALLGAGLYTHHRWKLRATSEGLLVISLLLVPLNFLAIAALTRERWSGLELAAEALSLAALGWLAAWAGDLVANRGRLLALALCGCSACILAMPRLVSNASAPPAFAVGALAPLACALGPTAWAAWLDRRQRAASRAAAAQQLVFLGVALFALAVAWGLLVFQTGAVAEALDQLSPALALACMAPLALGVAVWRGWSERADGAALATAGCGVALTAMLGLVASVILAWPQSLLLIGVGAIVGLGLSLVSWQARFPAAHAAALASFTMSVVVGGHAAFFGLPLWPQSGNTRQMIRVATDPGTGVILLGWFAVVATLAELWRRTGRSAEARVYSAVGWIVAACSAALAARWATYLPERAAGVYAAYGLALVASALRRRRTARLAWGQIALASAAALAAFGWCLRQPWFVDVPMLLRQPRAWQAMLGAQAALCIAWTAARLAGRGWPRWIEVVDAGEWSVDRAARLALVAGTAALVVLAALAGAGQELAPRPWQPAAWQSQIADPPGAIALALVALAILAAAADRWRTAELGAAILIGLLAAALAACGWSSDLAVASALRWALALAFAALGAVTWFRVPLARVLRGGGARFEIDPSARFLAHGLFVLAALAPVVALTATGAIETALGHRPQGPLPGTRFDLPPLPSNLVPLAVLVIVMVGHAVRERWPGYAFAAGALANATAVGGYVLFQVTRGVSLAGTDLIFLPQLSAIVAAGWALGGLATRRVAAWSELRRGATSALWTIQVGYPGLLLALLAVLGSGWIAAVPLGPPTELAAIGGPAAWVALALTALALAWRASFVSSRSALDALALILWTAGAMAACTALAWRSEDGAAYRTLIAAWSLMSVAVAATMAPRRLVLGWSFFPGALVVALAVRAVGIEPWGLAWGAAAVAMQAALAAVLAIRLRHPALVYVSGGLVNLTAALIWLQRHEPFALGDFLALQAASLAIVTAGWHAVEHLLRVPVPHFVVGGLRLDFGREANVLALALVVALAATALGSDVLEARGGLATDDPRWMSTALAALALSLTLSLRAPQATYALPALYTLGLSGIAWGISLADLDPWTLARAGALASAAFVALAAAVRAVWPAAAARAPGLRLPAIEHSNLQWLDPAQMLVGAATVLIAFLTVLVRASPRDHAAGSAATLLVAVAAALAATRTVDRRRQPARLVAYALATLSVVEFAWRGVAEGSWAGHLQRLALAQGVVTLATFLAWTPQLRGAAADWASSARRFGYYLAGVAAALAMAVVALEAWFSAIVGRSAPLDAAQTLGIVAAIIALAAQCIGWAVRADDDPLGRNGPRRAAYVYAAEALAALAVLHMRLARPEWFAQGLVRDHWTMIVLLVAFVGAGLSAWFERRGAPVLAEPLARTAPWLPLAAVAGHWLLPAALRYEALLVMCAAFYGWLAVSRRSSIFAATSVAALVAALWSFWHGVGIEFTQHPQLWLIPPAIVALAAEHLNRRRLTTTQAAGLRYAALATLYASSAADMYIAGIGQSAVWPLVLMGLSVGGVLLGIVLQVRAFVYLGASFLALVIVSLVWFAAVDLGNTWIWYAAAVALGLALLALFGVFERRRQDLERALREFKQWT